MFLFLHPKMLDVHVNDKKALEKLNSDIDYRRVFDCILVGVNIVSLECINDIAVFVASVEKGELVGLSFADVIKAVGQYEDHSGKLV